MHSSSPRSDICLQAFTNEMLLNQARAGLRPARTWFLEITFMRTSVCVCLCVCVCPPPGLLKTIHVK